MEDSDRFNWTLKRAIHASGMTQDALGKRARINASLISRIVRGTANPTLKERLAIAKVLKRDPQELFAAGAMEQAS